MNKPSQKIRAKAVMDAYRAFYDGVTRAELLKENPDLYRALRDMGRLDIVPQRYTTSTGGFTYVGTTGARTGGETREHAWYMTSTRSAFYRETAFRGMRRFIREPDSRVPLAILKARDA